MTIPGKFKSIISGEEPQTTINVGIFGHIDAGKSTLLGHLFYKLKYVDEKAIRKNIKEAKEMNKPSFHFAWMMDEMQEERERGITIDTNEKTIE